MSDVLFGMLFALGLFLVGLWGRRNAANLVPPTLGAEPREKKELELRRGAVTLIVLAVLITLGVVARVVFTLLR